MTIETSTASLQDGVELRRFAELSEQTEAAKAAARKEYERALVRHIYNLHARYLEEKERLKFEPFEEESSFRGMDNYLNGYLVDLELDGAELPDGATEAFLVLYDTPAQLEEALFVALNLDFHELGLRVKVSISEAGTLKIVFY